ncbi:MAG: helix-turn-helix transcriptional regulator [Spirochaetales bacterium]|nr:helix-turn-helix transcriptional regulator [Spirochaetales bacterium]
MTISEEIRMLCGRFNISIAELARRTGQSPQNLNSKLKRESFTVTELEAIAKATGTAFRRCFVLDNGEEV